MAGRQPCRLTSVETTCSHVWHMLVELAKGLQVLADRGVVNGHRVRAATGCRRLVDEAVCLRGLLSDGLNGALEDVSLSD